MIDRKDLFGQHVKRYVHVYVYTFGYISYTFGYVQLNLPERSLWPTCKKVCTHIRAHIWIYIIYIWICTTEFTGNIFLANM